MAKKKAAAKKEAPHAPASGDAKGGPAEPQAYDVTAAQNLGKTITGGPRIASGREGTIEIEPARYERLKRAGYFA